MIEKYKNQLNKDGFFIIKNFFNSEECELIRENWLMSKSMNVDSSDRFKNNMTDFFHGFYKTPKLVDLFRSLISENICVYFYRLMSKDQKWFGEVPPHQEAPYFHGGLNKLMCFVPISRMYKENGGLYIIKNSHKYGFLGRVNDHSVDINHFKDVEKIYVDVDLGDLIVFDFLLWHGSDTATIVEERPLYHIVYQPATDGSYWSQPLLVNGTWQTNYFLGFHEGVACREIVNSSNVPFESLSKEIDVTSIMPESGHCYTFKLTDALKSDKEGCSRLLLHEDGLLLQGKVSHNSIRNVGGGSYSHWGDQVYFSTVDNTDPRLNGKKYKISLG